MRIPLTPRRAWPAGETIVSLPRPTLDLGQIILYASRNSWPALAQVNIAIELLDQDDNVWKAVIGFQTVGGNLVDRNGNPITESYAGTRKRTEHGQTLPFFRHVWPHLQQTLFPQLRLRVNTTHPINSLIEVDW